MQERIMYSGERRITAGMAMDYLKKISLQMDLK